MGQRHNNRDEFFDDGGDGNVMGLLQKLQQQMGFLERKIDRLIELQGGESGSERPYSGSARQDRPSYRSKERPSFRSKESPSFRGRSGDDESRRGRSREDQDAPAGKKFYGAYTTRPAGKPSGKLARKSLGRPAGRPAGKPAGKSFGRAGTGKKRILFSKKKSA